MKSEVPLTPEQCLFASEHHNLVYKFLAENHLPRDEFYDVVIFGYLRAVSRYFNEPELQQYSFTTIAWRRMSACVSDYRRKQRRPKHNADIISLHIKQNEDSLPLEETIPAPNPYMQQLEEQLLLHDLAKRVSRQQMNIVRMKTCGYNDRDIARRQNTTTEHVQMLLKEVRRVLLDLCYG